MDGRQRAWERKLGPEDGADAEAVAPSLAWPRLGLPARDLVPMISQRGVTKVRTPFSGFG